MKLLALISLFLVVAIQLPAAAKLECADGSSSAGSPLAGENPDPAVRPPVRLAQYVAHSCVTPYGICPLVIPLPAGTSCYCPSVYGPIWGIAR